MSIQFTAAEWDAMQQRMDADVGIVDLPNQFGDPLADPLQAEGDPNSSPQGTFSWMDLINTRQSFASNVWSALEEIASPAMQDWMGQIDTGKNFGGNLWDALEEMVKDVDISKPNDAGEIASGALGESSIAAAESPVVAQTQTAAATGADTGAAKIASGAVAEAAGLDVLPDTTDLVSLAAGLIS